MMSNPFRVVCEIDVSLVLGDRCLPLECLRVKDLWGFQGGSRAGGVEKAGKKVSGRGPGWGPAWMVLKRGVK